MIAPWLASAWEAWARRLGEGRVPHAVLVQGPAGLGKRAFADAVVASLLCPTPAVDGHACGRCRDCGLRQAGTHPDRHVVGIEPEAREIRIEQVRRLAAELAKTSQFGGYRVAVIDPADRMNAATANALLKTLEEPAAAAVLILVADQPGRLPATIRSRCQRFDVRVPPVAQATAHLVGHGIEPDTARLLLELAAGNPGEALRLAGADSLRRIGAVVDDLAALATGRGSPTAAAAQWLRDDPGGRLGLGAAVLCWAVWRRHGAVADAPRLAPVVAAFATTPPDRLLALAAHADRVREQLATPLRADLLLAEWMLAAAAAGTAACAPGAR